MYIKINQHTARIILAALVAVAVANVIIVLFLSNYSGIKQNVPIWRKDSLRDNIGSVNEALEDEKAPIVNKVPAVEPDDHLKNLKHEHGMEDMQLNLLGNALFKEDEILIIGNETEKKLNRNAPVTAKELTQFLQTNRRAPLGCKEKHIFIVTFVISSPYSIYRRNAIRDSWGMSKRMERKNVVTIFTMGKHPDSWNHGGVISLEKEIVKYRDILKGRFKLEKESRTSLKILLGLQWIREYCKNVNYVLVVHDTMFVNYRRLVKALKYRDGQDSKTAKIWIGNIQKNQVPIRDPSSSHYISKKLYNESVYPPFCSSSAGYVMTMAAARDLYNAALTTHNVVPFIDLFTGVVARDRNWTLIHNNQLFSTGRIHSQPCAANRMAVGVAPEMPDEMVQLSNNLNNFTSLRKCMNPDLELVLPTDINNEPYLRGVLKPILDHPHICFTPARRPKDVFLVILISSYPTNFEMRNAIRRTWALRKMIDGEKLKLFFILGKYSEGTSQVDKQIKMEDARYKDIMQANFVDSFKNNTLKIILGLKWVSQNCPHAAYVYKGDEDTFVNFPNIIRYLKKRQSNGTGTEGLFLGSRIFGNRRFSPENKDDVYFEKFHVSDHLYRGHYYPPYCSGSGYILSSDLVSMMYREALRTPIIGVADAFQGILAKRLDVEPIGHRGFKSFGGKLDTCLLRRNDTMNVHGIGKTAKDQWDTWAAFTDEKVKCANIWGN